MNVFECGVEVKLYDKASAGLGALYLGFAKNQSAADKLQAQMNRIGSTFKTGLTMFAGGLAMAAPLVSATHAAMELQTALGRVQIATGASNAQMQTLNDTLTKTANATGIFSKPTLAGFAADMYSTGITRMDQLNKMLPLFAKGADLMKILTQGKINPEEAAHTFVAMAHQFGRYDEKSMRPIVEAAVAMAPALPGGLKTLKGMGSYVNVMGNRLMGVDPVQLMSLQAAIAQTSGGQGTGRGAMSGANLINALKRSMPGIFGSGLLTGQSAFSAEVMGLAKGGVSTIFKNQKLDLGLLINRLSSFEGQSGTTIAQTMLKHVDMLGKKAPEWTKYLHNFLKDPQAPKAQLITRLMQSQFGSAGTIAQLFGDEKFMTMLKGIQDRIKASKGIEAMQEQAMEMLEPQIMRMKTNWTTLASTIGQQMIPTLTKVVRSIGDVLDAANNFAAKNPKVVQGLVGLTAGMSGLLMLGGIGTMLKSAFMGLQFVAMPLIQVVTKLNPVTAALSVGVLLLCGGLIKWEKVSAWVKSQIYTHADLIKMGLAMVIVAANKAGEVLKGLAAGLGAFVSQVAGMAAGLAGKIGLQLPGLKELGDFGKNLEAFAKSQQGKGWTHDVLSKNMPDFEKGINGLTAELKTKYQKQKMGPPAPTKGDAIVGPGDYTKFLTAMKNYATQRNAKGIPGSSPGRVTTVKPGMVKQNINIHPGAIQVHGTSDPKKTAHETLKQLDDHLRHAASAITTAGGNNVSKWQFGT
ncbi:MAG TPA: phage tail tape measure protein [Oculatellaceae cyanobacterium]